MGAHERSPAWSPDGTRVGYFSDAGGEYALHVAPPDGNGEAKTFKLDGRGLLRRSPVGAGWRESLLHRQLACALRARRENRRGEEGGRRRRTRPQNSVTSGWSPDSKWIAYTTKTQALAMRLSVYSVEQDKSFPITDGLAEVAEPVFDRSGKYLYLFASTDAGPVLDWFAQSTTDNRRTRNVYLIVLRNDLPSPLAKESDEEKPAAARGQETTKPPRRERRQASRHPASRCASTSRASNTASSICRCRPAISNLQAGDANVLLLSAPTATRSGARTASTSSKRKDEVAARATCGRIAFGRRQEAALRSQNTWSIVPMAPKIIATDGRLNVAAIEVRIDPRAEWTQIFDEAWRINRDYFYAPNMHGVNWPAMKEQVRARCSKTSPTRSDLNRVIQWMCSELVGRPSSRRRRRPARDTEGRARRPARRRLQRRERPLPLQEGLRRTQLESSTAVAADRAGRQRQGGRIPARRAASATSGRRRTSTASSRTRRARSSRSRWARIRMVQARAP